MQKGMRCIANGLESGILLVEWTWRQHQTLVTDSMSALGIEATQENLTKFGDQLAKTAQKSNTSVSQLGEAVLTVGGTAKTLAGGTTELNTLLGIIADNGVKGAEGGTALRNIMLSLAGANRYGGQEDESSWTQCLYGRG